MFLLEGAAMIRCNNGQPKWTGLYDFNIREAQSPMRVLFILMYCNCLDWQYVGKKKNFQHMFSAVKFVQ